MTRSALVALALTLTVACGGGEEPSDTESSDTESNETEASDTEDTEGTDEAFCGAPVAEDVALCTSGVGALISGTAYGSLADALAAATSGDVISACPGLHYVNVELTQDVTIVGYGAEQTNLQHWFETGIDASAIYDEINGAVSISDGSLCLDGVHVTNNVIDAGAITAYRTAIEIHDSTFARNTGSALAISDPTSLLISGSTFEDNSSTYDFGDRGTHTGSFVDCTFEANVAPSGGVMLIGRTEPSTVDIQGGSATGNLSTSGVFTVHDGLLTVTDLDLGSGGDENSPYDAWGQYDYSVVSSFTCDESSCY